MTAQAWVTLAVGIFGALITAGGIIWKASSLVSDVATIKESVHLILTNHLPHIYEELKRLNK